MARPLKPIDEKQVKLLAEMGCSGDEIAAVVGCCRELIYKRFSTVLKEGHEKRNCSVRRAQYDVGVNKQNPTMLIWLGKQFLGQSDKIDYGSTSDADLIREAERLFGGAGKAGSNRSDNSASK